MDNIVGPRHRHGGQRAGRPRDPGHEHARDAATVEFGDLEAVRTGYDLIADLGNITELRDHEARDGLVRALRKADTSLLGEVLDVEQAVNRGDAKGTRCLRSLHQVVFVLDVATDQIGCLGRQRCNVRLRNIRHLRQRLGQGLARFDQFGGFFGDFGDDPFFAPLPGRSHIAAIRREALRAGLVLVRDRMVAALATWRGTAAAGRAGAALVDVTQPLRKAFVVSVLNPKAILFLLSFFIQFVDPAYASMEQRPGKVDGFGGVVKLRRADGVMTSRQTSFDYRS